MLFNTFVFVLGFLPVVLIGYRYFSKRGRIRVILWLLACSFFFYGWWNPVFLWLLAASITANYIFGWALFRFRSVWALTLGVVANLTVLSYYKYTNFVIENVNAYTEFVFPTRDIVLPLAISFFTFQQIAYLVETYRGHTPRHGFWEYALYIAFFPQFIAGPIVTPGEMLPQFRAKLGLRLDGRNLAVGFSIFVIGLFKKVVIADSVAPYATSVFTLAAGGDVAFLEAWAGILAYTFQIYFDFSGYSDMAIGLARMFGIRLPLNFYAPYKARSIIDFWRRWHITLSRFLRDYLYFSLGGSRRGPILRHGNLIVVMLLGGLWHGAAWTFVIWGGLHGLYLVINHAWRNIARGNGWQWVGDRLWFRGLSWLVTFLGVVVAWVFFRADSFGAAIVMLEGMAGLNGFSDRFLEGGIPITIWLILASIAAFVMPSTQDLMRRHRPSIFILDRRMALDRPLFLWRPTVFHALVTTALFLISATIMFVSLNEPPNEFIYFRF